MKGHSRLRSGSPDSMPGASWLRSHTNFKSNSDQVDVSTQDREPSRHHSEALRSISTCKNNFYPQVGCSASELGQSRSSQHNLDVFWQGLAVPHPSRPYAVLPRIHGDKPLAESSESRKGTRSVLESYEEARIACAAEVERIVKDCYRLNQKYRDVSFDIEANFRKSKTEQCHDDCLVGLSGSTDQDRLCPGSVRRVGDMFDQPQFFIKGATANDVRQGKDGDCWFMSALTTLSNKKGLIQNVCVARNEIVGVYGFVFNRDGEWISVIIDDKLYLNTEDYHERKSEQMPCFRFSSISTSEHEYRRMYQTGSRALYFAQCSDPNETWLPLLEKAFAKVHGDYSALGSGFVGEGIEDLTAGVTTEIFSSDILDKDRFWREELLKVNDEFLFGCGQMGGDKHGQRDGILEQHAYSIMEAREINSERLVKLRNPWGNTEWRGAWSDGSSEWTAEWMTLLNHTFGDDGVFWISYKDLLKYYQHFDRTRLFGPEWTITQRWTSLCVPWSEHYLDTKFTFTLHQDSPVVIVLSQLDDRYFRGLEGHYDFFLHFRLQNNAKPSSEYLVDSNKPCFMKRSTSVEINLVAGAYSVLMKVIARRIQNCPVVEDVIRETFQSRPDKLRLIGRSFDLAHEKGRFLDLEVAREQQARSERIMRRKQHARRMFEARRRAARKRKLRLKKNEQMRRDKQHLFTVQQDDTLLQLDVPSSTSSPKVEAVNHQPCGPGWHLDDVSDDELSWDSEIDAPSDDDCQYGGGSHIDRESSPSAFTDGIHVDGGQNTVVESPMPEVWDPVCVVGLRIFSHLPEIAIGIECTSNATCL